tara:strand:+ start:92 stop:592 length:501 start_codon:yes stop_codon:yes gene_type:complete
MFEEAILKNTPEQIAKLWNPAIKAHEDPSIGVKEFTKKAAYYVIRDCAKITRQYLPIHVWELYDDPIGSLKGKFTKVDVEDFLARSRKEPATTALKKVIVSDIKLKHKITQPTANEDVKQAITFEESEDDLYGYYEGYDEEEEDTTPVVSSTVSLSDDELIRKYLL